MRETRTIRLKGRYSIYEWEELARVLILVPAGVSIDYSECEIDVGVKVIIDDFNLHGNEPVAKIDKVQEHLRLLDLQRMQDGAERSKNFFEYIRNFVNEKIFYVADIVQFFSIFKKRPKYAFQRQIMMQDAINSCYNIGAQAVPIIMFLSFSLGVIVALQSALQLKSFGAELYALDLVIVSFFKEMGLLVAIIVLAARSGSSMISKLGIMRIGDEWNVIRILGLDPDVFLLIPRIIAFTVVAPLLAYLACFVGVVGGYVVLQPTLNIGSVFLINAFRNLIDFQLFISVLFKGLLFGLLIGCICSIEVKRVSTNSESIVRGITQGVVYSIFACVFVDMIINIVVVEFF